MDQGLDSIGQIQLGPTTGTRISPKLAKLQAEITRAQGFTGKIYGPHQFAAYERDRRDVTPPTGLPASGRTYAQPSAYKLAFREFIEGFGPTHFVSLVFNHDTSLEGAWAKLGEFQRRICRSVVHRNWTKPKYEQLLPEYIAVAEHVPSNLHIHAAYRLQPGQEQKFILNAKCHWDDLMPSGSLDIQAATDPAGLGIYLAKEITVRTTDQFWLSSPRG